MPDQPNEVNAAWRVYREEQAARRRERVPKRRAVLLNGLPPGFTAQILNNGYCVKVQGPNRFKLVWYPTHEKVCYLNRWSHMRAERVVRLLQEVANAG